MSAPMFPLIATGQTRAKERSRSLRARDGFNHVSFDLSPGAHPVLWESPDSGEIEVIGNVYENPEFLNGEGHVGSFNGDDRLENGEVICDIHESPELLG